MGSLLAERRNPDWKEGDSPRFRVFVNEHYEVEEPGWHYQLLVVDLKYRDDDRYPIEAVAHGDSWAQAYRCAGEFIDRALASPTCIF